MIRRLTILAHLGTFTGYHALVNSVFKWLTKAGIFVSIRATATDEQWGKVSAIPLEMRSQIVHTRQPEDFELLIGPPDQRVTPGRKTIWWTMYESTEMPKQYVSLLSQAECVIVPCAWNRDSFQANGLKVPIEVVNLGFDSLVYQPSPIAMNGPTVIGIAGRTRHCARRKGMQEAINLFLKTFPDDETIRLHVKLHPDDIIETPKDHRVKIVKQHFEDYELARWIQGLTVYMTLSRGEGFSLWPLNCMASGRPVIGAAYGGQKEFMAAENSFIVPHREVDADSGESNVQYLGQWAKLDENVAAGWMRAIHKTRASAVTVGEQAAASVQHLTWESATNKLISVLEGVGAL